VAWVRPLRPENKRRLSDGMERMSPESRFMRFVTSKPGLSRSERAYLTEVDQENHIAWGALAGLPDADGPSEVGIAVGRSIRLGEEPKVGECAVAVVDEWQGCGLGTLLLGVLAEHAAKSGIELFRGYLRTYNQAMPGLLPELEAPYPLLSS